MSELRKLLEDLKTIEDQHHMLAEPEKAATAKLREITTGLVAMTEQLDSCVSSLQSSVSSLSSSVSALSSRVSTLESAAAAQAGGDKKADAKGPADAPAAADDTVPPKAD